MSPAPSHTLRVLAALAIVAAAAIALAWWLWSPLVYLELLGWDSYPLIASSHARGGDVFGAFTSELMGGRYPLGRYWRPLVELTFAYDHLRCGLDPRGYLADDLVWLIAGSIALGWLALELIGRERFSAACVGAVIASLAFIVQPVLWDVLPAPARRADTMALLFTALALASAGPGLARWSSAVWVALALASKETGAVALPAVVALAAWSADAPDWRARAHTTWRATWPALVAFAVAFALRTSALGGLGGGRESSASSALARTPSVLLDGASVVLAPRGAGPTALLMIVATLLALGVVVRITRHERAADLRPRIGFARSAGFLATWTLLLAAVTTLSGVDRSWYELPFAAVRCVWIGLLAGHGIELLRRTPSRATGAVALLLAAWLAVSDALDSQRWTRATTLSALGRASWAQREFLDRFEQEVQVAPNATRIVLDGFPREMPLAPARKSDKPRTLTLLAPYSLEAYAELALPARRVRLEYPGSRTAPPSIGEVVVVLAR